MTGKKFDRKQHWETIYQTKSLSEVSWYQAIPQTSLDLIEKLGLPTDARIIDVGGGDSLLVDHLLERGYTNVSVLDISEAAIKRAQNRLAMRAGEVSWIVADIASFKPEEPYDLWHDRAVFHFLTRAEEVNHYRQAVGQGVKAGGNFIIGTFSEKGPQKCSGIEISQYSTEDLKQTFSQDFRCLNCQNPDHATPFNTVQNFSFCSFQKK